MNCSGAAFAANTSVSNPASNGVTMAPRLRRNVTSPSVASSLSASRKGVRETSNLVQNWASGMQIAADEGLAVVLNPGSNMRLFNGPPPVASLQTAGVKLAVGPDNCALNDDEDVLAELRLAAILGRAGRSGSGRAEAGDTLRMITQYGAGAIFRPDQAGMLAPGRPADLAAFRFDESGAASGIDYTMLTERLIAQGKGNACMLTMVAGNIRFANRAEDHRRLQSARIAALDSVMARAQLADDTQIVALQTALKPHYARRIQKAR